MKEAMEDSAMVIWQWYKRKGKERCLYNARRFHWHGQAVISCGCLKRVVEGDMYFVLSSRNLLLDKWQDVYKWYLDGRVPTD